MIVVARAVTKVKTFKKEIESVKMLLILITILLLTVSNTFTYRILGVFPTTYHSHYKTGSALMKGLAAAGHDVSVISPFTQSPPMPNYREITIHGAFEQMISIRLNLNLK